MPLLLTVSCFSKIQIGFTFLVLAHPGSPGKRAVKRVCVCVCVVHVQDCCSILKFCYSNGCCNMPYCDMLNVQSHCHIDCLHFRHTPVQFWSLSIHTRFYPSTLQSRYRCTRVTRWENYHRTFLQLATMPIVTCTGIARTSASLSGW